jgi:hypothetical protein
VLLRAFITCDLFGQCDVVATHYAGEDDENNQSSEEILLSVADRLEEGQLPELALRLALCSHIRSNAVSLGGSVSFCKLHRASDDARRRIYVVFAIS